MKLTIAKKLYITAGLACLALLALGAFSILQVRSLTARTDGIIKEDMGQVMLCKSAMDELGKAIQAYKNYLLRKDDRYVGEFREHTGKIDGCIKDYLALSTTENERAPALSASAELQKYEKSIDELVAARGKSDDIAAVDRGIKGVDKPLGTALAEMESVAGKNFESARSSLQASTSSRLIALFACVVLVAILVAAMGIYVARNITMRLARFSAIISRVAENDLTARVKIHADDELGDMGKNFNMMMSGVEEMIKSIQNSVLELSEKSKKLFTSADLMAKNSEEVAVQSQSVATASEEMAATSSEIANNCGSAAEGARQASDSAHSGAGVVQDTVGGMERIADSVRVTASTIESLGKRSDQIGEIIGTIEDIADQTNLLALNAAIEAARAGDMGRGFAVVADEVRALAERTTKATREIGEMIKTIQSETRGAVSSMDQALNEVEKGTEDAGRSGAALQEILDQIQQVNMQVSQIATAAEEQNATTGEIANYIQNVTTVMHGSAELAATSTQAADELARLAESLQTNIRRFKTEGSELFILELAKEDHRAFVENVEAVLQGKHRQDGVTISTNHTCRFGKWYDKEGMNLCGHLPSYRAINTPHERIHSIARQVVDAVNSGNIQQAEKLFPQLAELSQQIITLLGDIRREFEQQCNSRAA
jgi:methyl-accepting chemotaxis protein